MSHDDAPREQNPPVPGPAEAATPETPTPGPPPPPKRANTLWPEGTTFDRADKVGFSWLAFATVFNLAMLPARPVLLGMAPLALVTLTGSRTGMVAVGAHGSTGAAWWPLGLVLGILSLVKFHWIYWWAGKRFGDWFIASMIGPGERAARRAKRAEAITRRYDVLAMLLTFIPFVPVPAPIVYAILGTSGTRLRRFLVLDIACAALLQSLYLYLGWQLGEPAVQLLDEFAKYSWYLTGAIVLFIVIGAVRSARREQKEQAGDEA